MIERRFTAPRVLAAALILGAAAFTAGAAHAQSDDVIKFGFASPYSGSAAEWGPMHEASAAMAIEDINAAGGVTVDGKQYTLQLIRYDHAYDPTKVVTVAQQAVHQDKVRFLEILGGGVIAAAQPITEPAGVILFGSGVGSAWVGPDHPLTFRSYYDTADTAIHALEYLKDQDTDAKSIVLMYPDDELGHNLAEAVIPAAEKLGFEAKAVFTGRDVTDFYPVLLNVMELKPDYIDFGPTPGSQYASMIRQAGELGYEGRFIFSDTVNLDAIKTAGVEDAVMGSIVTPAWVEFNTPVGQKWAERYRERQGQIQPWTAQSYDNLLLLKAAIEKANSFDTAEIAEALEEVSVEGMTGEISYGGEDRIGIKRLLRVPASVGLIEQGEDGPVVKQIDG